MHFIIELPLSTGNDRMVGFAWLAWAAELGLQYLLIGWHLDAPCLKGDLQFIPCISLRIPHCRLNHGYSDDAYLSYARALSSGEPLNSNSIHNSTHIDSLGLRKTKYLCPETCLLPLSTSSQVSDVIHLTNEVDWDPPESVVYRYDYKGKNSRDKACGFVNGKASLAFRPSTVVSHYFLANI